MRVETHRFTDATHLFTVPSVDPRRSGPVTVAYWVEAPGDWTDLRVRREVIDYLYPLDPVWGEFGQGHEHATAYARIFNLKETTP